MVVESQQPDMFAAVSITLVAAAVAITLRFAARRMTKVPIWWDDFMCIGSFVFGAGWSALLILWSYYGFGLQLKDIELTPKESLTKSLLFCYLAEIFYALSLACAKFAVLAFYWRMFRTSNIKIPIIALVIATTIWFILRTFLAIFHCVPVQAFWDREIPNATCQIDDSKFFFGTVLVHLIIDLFILSLPVYQVRKLQLKTAQKVGVIALFMFGTLVCIASVIVLVYSISYDTNSPEISWNVAPIMIWATVEVNLAVISACLPMLRPIFLKVFKRIFPNASIESSNEQNNPRNLKSLIKMSAMKSKTRSIDDSDSVHQLTRPDNDDCMSDNGDEEQHIYGTGLAKVVITGNGARSDLEREISLAPAMGGIFVRSETIVQVSQAK
ncbi:hypothetical protein TruAng_006120 [Truncatella angustata]|nr:hypothetical protein TruAng_006120 [Truncatella angustata]